MPATRFIFLLLSLLLLQTSSFLFSQSSSYPVKEWVKKLDAGVDPGHKKYFEVMRQLNGLDSAQWRKALTELEKEGSSAGHYFRAKFFYIKSTEFLLFSRKEQAKWFCENALKEAYATGDDQLISFISWLYGEEMYALQEIELAATYALNAVELNKKQMNVNSTFNYGHLGEILFHAREFEKCIYYTNKQLQHWHDTSVLKDYYKMKFRNTMGQAWQQLGNLDSALANYIMSLELAEMTDNNPWKGINSGFMGQVYFMKKDYQKAKTLFNYDFSINRMAEWNIAGYTLQWLAKIYLIEGKKDSALATVKEGLNFLLKSRSFPLQQQNYLQQAYYTTADVYRTMGNADSFYHYFRLYSVLHDSLERVAALSSAKMTQLRINNLKNYHTIQSLEREKKAEILKRNFILAAIIMLAAIVILVLNWQRQKSLYRQQLALQQKATAEAEVSAAREQLQLFTDNILEKTDLIEKLQQQVQYKEQSADQQKIIDELSHRTILTEDDWEKFKTLFEKNYPGFFVKLKEKAVDITVAEQRMAALTRLHLSTKEIAAMLGISVDSVHKSRQRLRQRLHLGSETNLEETIAYI